MDLFSPLFEILKSLASVGAHVATAIIALLLGVILVQNRRIVRQMYSRSSHLFLSETPPNMDTRINRYLNNAATFLQASSIALIQWHNGHHNLMGMPFYYASLTHIRPIEKSCLLRNPLYQSIQSSVLATTHDLLKTKYLLEYPDIEIMKNHDMGLYYILKELNCVSAYIAGIYNMEGIPIAFIGCHYLESVTPTPEQIAYLNRLAKVMSGAFSLNPYDRRK